MINMWFNSKTNDLIREENTNWREVITQILVENFDVSICEK